MEKVFFKFLPFLAVLLLASCSKSEQEEVSETVFPVLQSKVSETDSVGDATVDKDYNIQQYMSKAVTSSQGMDIFDSLIFVVQDGGVCRVYNYDTKASQYLATFNLGSKRSGNHCNCANFGVETKDGATFPLLYVSNGKVNDVKEWVLNVESITHQANSWSSECVQAITMDQSDYSANALQPIWGCPNWVVDKKRKMLWAFSAIKRTTLAGTGADMSSNKYVATGFRLPALSEGCDVVFKAKDVVKQVLFTFDTYVTQGGTMYDGKIYYCFGFGGTGTETPSRICVYDTDTGEICGSYELDGIVTEEMEDLSLKDGKLYINTNSAKIYELSANGLPTGIRPVRI